MSTSRNVMLVVGGGLLAAWLAAAAGGAWSRSPRRGSESGPIGPTPPPGLLLNVSRLEPAGPSPRDSARGGRNLFRFRSSSPAGVSRQAAESIVSAFEAAAAAFLSPPPQPEWKLVGIAERVDGERRVRTAIVSGSRDVYLVTEGARVADEFEVVRIQADSVDLRRLSDGTALTLRLNVR